MSDDTIMVDDEGNRYSYESIRGGGYRVGHIAGLEACVRYIENKAVRLFSSRQHDEAIALQKLATEMKEALEPDMRADITLHETLHPAMLPPEPAFEVPEPQPERDEPLPAPTPTLYLKIDESRVDEQGSESGNVDDDIPF